MIMKFKLKKKINLTNISTAIMKESIEFCPKKQ